MPPGVASVVVQVVTGDADSKLKHLGDTAIAQAKAMEAAYAKSGAVMSASFEESSSAIDVALISNKKYQESLVEMERAKLQLWNTTLKTAADTEAAEKRVTAAMREQKVAADEYVKSMSAMSAARKAAADKAVADSERELEAAKRAARIIPAQRGAYDKAVGNTIVAKTGATREADEQIAAQKKLEDAAGRQAAALQGVQRFGGKALLGVGVAATVAGVEFTKMGLDFESAQKKYEAFSGQGERAGKALTATFQGTAGQFKQSGQELEGAYAGVAQQVDITQGHVLNAAESLKFMTSVSNLTTASGEKLGNITKDLASVMQVYKVKLGDTAKTSNEMFNATRQVSTSVDSMTSLVTKLHARLGDIGGGLSSVLGLMTEASSFGLTGGRGVLIFNQALERLTSDSKKTTEVLEALGVHLHNTHGEFVGLPSVVDQLHGSFKNLTQGEREWATQQLFGKGATGEFTEIIRNGKKGLEDFTDRNKKAGEVQRAAKKETESFTGQLEVMWAAIQTAGGAFGQSLIPGLKTAAGVLKDSADWLTKNSWAAKALAEVIGLILGAAISVFVYDKVVLFGKGIQRMIEGLALLGKSFGVTASEATASAGVTTGAKAEEAAAVGTSDAAIVTANETAAGSFVSIGGVAVAAAATTTGAAATTATGVAASDAAIVGANVTAGLSFGALAASALKGLGLIVAGFVTAEAAAHVFGSVLEGITGERQPQSLKELIGGEQPGEKGIAEADKHATGKGNPQFLGEGKLGSSNQYKFVSEVAKKYGVSPHTLWGIYGTETSYGSNITTSSTGAKGSFQFEPGTAKTYGYPETNKPNATQRMEQAVAAARLIAAETRKYHSEGAAVEAYYAGHPGTSEGADYRKKVEAAGGAHFGAAEKKEAENNPGNKKLQELLNEAEHGKPKKGKAGSAYVDPFANAKGLKQGREDMGIDYTMQVGSAIDAIGAGIVKQLHPWGGSAGSQPYLEYELTEGSHKGQDVYLAEQINAKVKEGQRIKKGQEIATYAASGTGLETGFGYKGTGRTLAQATTGFTDKSGNDPTTASKEFASFLKSVAKGGSATFTLAAAAQEAAKALESIEKQGLTLFRKYEDAIQNGTVKSLEKLTGVTEKDPKGAHSVQAKELTQTEAALKMAGLGGLASKLATVHREALEALNTQIETQGKEKEAERFKEEAKQGQDELSTANTVAEKTLSIRQDESTKASNAIQAAAQKLGDASTVLRSESDKAIQALQDAAQEMSDQFSGRSTAVKDASQVKVDELNERGKYGLDAQAQREQVALDQMKQQYDAQIAAAKIALDGVKTQEDGNVSLKSLNVATITARENAAEAAQQARVDGLRIAVDQLDLKMLTKGGQVQLHADERTSQDIYKQMLAALKGESKKDQDALAATTKKAESFGEVQVQSEAYLLGYVERQGKSELQSAEAVLAEIEANAGQAIAEAQKQLTEAEDASKRAVAEGQTGVEKLSGEAEVKESEAEGKIKETEAESSTQYAGSGLVVNFTNIPLNDAAAIQSEMGFLMRTKLPA